MSKELINTEEIIVEEGLEEVEFICPQCSKILENIYQNTTLLGSNYQCPDCDYKGMLEDFHGSEFD